MKINSRALNRAHRKYESEIDNLEAKIQEVADFELAIFYQQSDGFVVLHCANGHNAGLADCLKVINEKGFLTEEDYLQHTI